MEITFKTNNDVGLSLNIVSENDIELSIFNDDTNKDMNIIIPLSYSELETIKDCIDSILKRTE